MLASCTQEKMMRGNFFFSLSNRASSKLLGGSAAAAGGEGAVNISVRCLTMNLEEKMIPIKAGLS